MFYAKLSSFTKLISIRWRLTILFVAVFGTTFTLFAIFIFNFLASTLQREFDDALFNYAVDVHESINLDPTGDLSLSTPALDRGKLYPFALGTALIQIRHINGEVFTQVGDFGSLVVPFRKEIDRINSGEEEAFRTINKLEGLPNKEAEEYRLITLPIDNSPKPQLFLQVAVPMTLLDTQISSRKIVLGISVPLAILIALLGGYFLSTRALTPVIEMVATAKAIGGQRLSNRVVVPPVKDEIQALALALNEMLTRIEAAFASQERFIADASHQLLTPLAIMRGEIEASLRKGDGISPELLQSNLQEVDHLTQIVQQLLLLARVEAGRGALELSPVSLADVIMDAIARANRSAQKKSIRIQFDVDDSAPNDDSSLVSGDYDLLQNLVYNLIENAVKYSPAGSQVRVSLSWKDGHQILRVEDNGRGIPEEQLSLIFERFHRVDDGGDGHGLGLAIAKKIADAHGANLWAENKYMNLLHKNESSGCIFGLEVKNF